MVRWLSRREKVNVFSERVAWAVEQETERLDAKNKKRRKKRKPQSKPRVELAEQPSSSNVSIPTLTHDYGATHFTSALQTFIGTHRSPTRSGYMAQESDASIRIPFSSVDVWHRVKFHSPSIQTTAPDTDDIADAIPARYNKARRVIQHARFDTVFVNGGTAQKSGIKGTKNLSKHAMLFSQIYPKVSVLDRCASSSRYPRNIMAHSLAKTRPHQDTLLMWSGSRCRSLKTGIHTAICTISNAVKLGVYGTQLW